MTTGATTIGATTTAGGGKLVKIAPQGNGLPMAINTALCAVKCGLKLDNAKSSYQYIYCGRRAVWSDNFVDELKCGLLSCRVIQMFNNLVSQAGQMDLRGIPNDIIQAFSEALYSFLAKRRLRFGPIARVTAAFFFYGAGMAYAVGIQKLIYNTRPCYDQPLSLPVYFILAVAGIFGFITASEYAYNKAPQDMKTIVQALTQLTACLGSALGMALSPVARDPHLVTMYACLAALMGLCTTLFWWKFRKYDKVGAELNRLAVRETYLYICVAGHIREEENQHERPLNHLTGSLNE
ncbi:hypothetical protein AOQ84DRAFT_400952 [Glonium stellatum]|uniref:Uncharacterized protein n=1 Tax=Glonium stellatum TaxID=574774 RepID=A0A8E2EQG8_9PEZI|nr:hypothetical protein AOQ84DRAFT_400952 [Glonium stellatum]